MSHSTRRSSSVRHLKLIYFGSGKRMHAHTRTHISTHTHTHTYTSTHTSIHTHTISHTQSHSFTHIHSLTQTLTHTQYHTHIITHMHTLGQIINVRVSMILRRVQSLLCFKTQTSTVKFLLHQLHTIHPHHPSF